MRVRDQHNLHFTLLQHHVTRDVGSCHVVERPKILRKKVAWQNCQNQWKYIFCFCLLDSNVLHNTAGSLYAVWVHATKTVTTEWKPQKSTWVCRLLSLTQFPLTKLSCSTLKNNANDSSSRMQIPRKNCNVVFEETGKSLLQNDKFVFRCY